MHIKYKFKIFLYTSPQCTMGTMYVLIRGKNSQLGGICLVTLDGHIEMLKHPKTNWLYYDWTPLPCFLREAVINLT